MISSKDAEEAGNLNEAKLHQRDWLVLPMLGLLTVCFIAGSTELIARLMLGVESKPFIPACMGPVDQETGGARAIPNSVCWDKKFESEWVEYKFNSCGHRAGMECGPKPPGTYRIVMMGASFTMGHLMSREKTFAALLPTDLTHKTGRKIELYNEGMITVNPHVSCLRMNEVLAANPDMILWALSPGDLEQELPHIALINPPYKSSSFLAKAWFRLKATFASESILDAMHDLWERGVEKLSETAAATLLQRFMYDSQAQYVRSHLEGDDEGFLRVLPSAEWRSRLLHFDSDASEIEHRATAANVPLVAVLVPNRVQVAMISMGKSPAGYDPYELDNELRSIVTSHGGIYVDILPDYRSISNPEHGYFPVDGHPNAEGHAMIARLLAKALTDGAVPDLRVVTQPQAVLEHGR